MDEFKYTFGVDSYLPHTCWWWAAVNG